MGFNKDLIFRFIFSIGLILFIARVLFPIILDKFRGKNLGLSKDGHDLDYLIKSKKEQLKSQYQKSDLSSEQKNEIQINNELKWGAQKYTNEIKSKISKTFGHGFSENKITKFITTNINQKEFKDVIKNINDFDQIINVFINAFIFYEITNEIIDEELSFTEKCAKKIQINPQTFALAIQIKILKQLKQKQPNINEYLTYLDLKKINSEQIYIVFLEITKLEGHKWKNGISSFFEELSLNITYAQFLTPLAAPKNKEDFYIAYKNLNSSEKDNIEEIKKRYKKLALQMHPDKITPLKLPKSVEKQAIDNFNIIQKSYEIITTGKKNE